MTKTEMLQEIKTLHTTLKDESQTLSSADRVSIVSQIGELQDRVSLLDFQEHDDIDYGYHDQYDQ
jgi:hypothetical protein